MLLALDPSSSKTGYAVFRGGALIDAGLLTPNRTRDAALERIDVMITEIAGLITVYQIEQAVIEMTSGKVGRRHRGAGAGLGVYGQACGAMWQALRERLGPANVIAVDENQWTRQVPKAQRAAAVASQHAHYDPAADPGLDVADAIGLGEWWLTTQRLEEHAER